MPNQIISTGPLWGGMSEQPASVRNTNQSSDAKNILHSVQNGAEKRPGTETVFAITGLTADRNYRIHSIKRDETEEYLVIYGQGAMRFFDLTGTEIKTRVETAAQTYLDNGTPSANDYALTTIADFTIVANRTVVLDGTVSETYEVTTVHRDYDAMIAHNPATGTYHRTEESTATRTTGTYKFTLEENGFAEHTYGATDGNWDEVVDYWNNAVRNPLGFKVIFTEPDTTTHTYNVLEDFFEDEANNFDEIARRFTARLQAAGATNAMVRYTDIDASTGKFTIVSPYRGIGAAVTNTLAPDGGLDITDNSGEPFYGGSATAGIGSPQSVTFDIDDRWERVPSGSNQEDAELDATTMPIKMVRTFISGYGSTYESAVEADAYVYYRLGESSGTSAADEMEAHTGTHVSSPALGVTGAISGDANTAVTYPATSEHTTITTLGTFGSDMADGFAISAWFKTDGTPTTAKTICGINHTSEMRLELTLNENESGTNVPGKIAFFLTDNSSDDLFAAMTTADTGIYDDAYHHIVINCDPAINRIDMWLDGVKEALTFGAQDSLSDLIDFTLPLYLGVLYTEATTTLSQSLAGELDEFALYKHILTDSEIELQYQRGIGSAWSLGTTYFHLSEINWGFRETGNKTTNPIPEPWLQGFKISDTAFHRNRYILASDEHVLLSEADDFFDFYLPDHTNIGPAAPIDALTSGGGDGDSIAVCDFIVPFRKSLLVFTKAGQQYELNAPETLTPTTASVTPSTAYQSLEGVRPSIMGSQVYFLAANGDSNAVYEYYYDDSQVSNIAANVTSHVQTLLPTSMKSINAMENTNTVICTALDTNILYVYKMFWNGIEKLQSAWGKYVFDSADRIVDIAHTGTTAYMLVEDAQGYFIRKMTVPQDNEPGLFAFETHMDNTSELTGTFGGTNTTWTLPVADETVDSIVLGPDFTASYVDGSSAYLAGSAYITSTALVTSKNFSFSCWVKITSPAGTNTMFTYRDADSPNHYITLKNTTAPLTLAFTTYDGSTITNTTTGVLTENAWVHVAVTWASSGTVNIYINGVKESFSNAGNPTNIDSTFYGHNGSSQDFYGIIAHIAEWSTAVLTDAQVVLLAAGTNPQLLSTVPTRYFADLQGAGPHAPTLGSGTATEVGSVTDGASDPDVLGIVSDISPGDIKVPTSVSGTTVTLAGRWNHGEVRIGRAFTYDLELSRPYLRGRDGQVLLDIELQIAKATINFKEAGNFGLKIKQGTRATRTPNYSPPTGTIIESEETKQFLVMGNTKNTTMTITDSSVYPLVVSSVEYVVTATQRSE